MHKVIVLSEMGFTGKVPRDHRNMRTEFAQFCALEADHHPMLDIHNVKGEYDFAFLLIGKTAKFRDAIYNYDIVSEARKFAKKVYFFQEGPVWIYQDMPLHHQFWHLNVLYDVDGILCENVTDIPYYKGINPKANVRNIPSLMILDLIKDYPKNIEDRKDTMIGGTFCRWYGGADSYLIARQFNTPIYAPSMGRKKPEEDNIPELTYLPYMEWVDWIKELNKYKYAVHLMPTIAAGTFAMNCAYLGIPCIGYRECDTQRQLHPKLTVEQGDLSSAKFLAEQLRDDPEFYKKCSEQSKKLFHEIYTEEKFKQHMNSFLFNWK